MQQSQKRTRGDFISRASWDISQDAVNKIVEHPKPQESIPKPAHLYIKQEDFSKKNTQRHPISSPGQSMNENLKNQIMMISQELAHSRGHAEFLKSELSCLESRFIDLSKENEVLKQGQWQSINATEDLQATIFCLSTENDRLKKEVDICMGLNFLPEQKVEDIVEKMENMNMLLADQIRANRELRAEVEIKPENLEKVLQSENEALIKGEQLTEEVKKSVEGIVEEKGIALRDKTNKPVIQNVENEKEKVPELNNSGNKENSQPLIIL